MLHGLHRPLAAEHGHAVVQLHMVLLHLGHAAHGLVHDQRAVLAVHALDGELDGGGFGLHGSHRDDDAKHDTAAPRPLTRSRESLTSCYGPSWSSGVRPAWDSCRKAVGVMPVSCLNCALKCAALLKPAEKAISEKVISP